MSLQVFLQAQLLGVHQFLSTNGPSLETDLRNSDLVFLGQCAWLNLYMEVLPRALLGELALSPLLLGSSSAEQFLLVLAEEDVERATQLLQDAAEAVRRLSGGTLELMWAATENLGSWPVARKRLDDSIHSALSTGVRQSARVPSLFQPFQAPVLASDYFHSLGEQLSNATAVCWQRGEPDKLQWSSSTDEALEEGKRRWPLLMQPSEAGAATSDAILLAQRIARNDLDESRPAGMPELAARAEGASRWALLLGDVDGFDARLRNQGSVEEYIHLSVLFREFFAGELSVLCMLPEFWRKVTVLYRGGASFAIAGSWDALLALARELRRLFGRFAEEHLTAGGTEAGRTISMAFAVGGDDEESMSQLDLPHVYRKAAGYLAEAKAVGVDNFHLFGRTIEWKRLNEAEELKDSLMKLVSRHRVTASYIQDLASLYRESNVRETAVTTGRKARARTERPWRLYLRMARVVPPVRGKEATQLRAAVIANLLGKLTGSHKLRPSGRVGLEWARLEADRSKVTEQN